MRPQISKLLDMTDHLDSKPSIFKLALFLAGHTASSDMEASLTSIISATALLFSFEKQAFLKAFTLASHSWQHDELAGAETPVYFCNPQKLDQVLFVEVKFELFFKHIR